MCIHSTIKTIFSSAWKTFTIEEIELYIQTPRRIILLFRFFFFDPSYKYCSFKKFQGNLCKKNYINVQLPVGFAVGGHNPLWFKVSGNRNLAVCFENTYSTFPKGDNVMRNYQKSEVNRGPGCCVTSSLTANSTIPEQLLLSDFPRA